MYLTSQRVSAPGDDRTGINTFLYKHEGAETAIDWSEPDLERIVEELPGRPTSCKLEVPPGGNLVRSFLDIVTSDSTAPETIRSALRKLEEKWSPAQVAQVIHIDGVALRLGVELRLEAGALDELRTHGERSLRLLEEPPRMDWQPNAPLRVVVAKDGQASSYALEEHSIARLQPFHGPQWRPAQVSLSQEIQPSLAIGPLDVYSHLASLLTGLALDALIPLGGIQFCEPGGQVLWQWPLPSDARGYCLGCHQHGTLRQAGTGYQCTFCGNTQDTDGLWIATLT